MATRQTTPSSRTDLVFICGVHRSGTTILYNLLAEFGGFAFPTPFHINAFDAFRQRGLDVALALRPRLAAEFQRRGIVDRFIDDIDATIASPEEYGFVLPGGTLRPDTLPAFEALCEFVAATSPQVGAPLLMKNPRDMIHLAAIMAQFPRARFVVIHRRPEHVLYSRGRELRELFHRRSAYQAIIEPLYARLSASPVTFRALGLATRIEPLFSLYLARRQVRELRAYLAAVTAGVAEACIELRYEDLLAAPGTELNRVLEFLAWPAVDPEVIAGRLRPPRTPTDVRPPGSRVLRRRVAAYYRRWRYA